VKNRAIGHRERRHRGWRRLVGLEEERPDSLARRGNVEEGAGKR
jgi:hypothetical protein